MASHWKSAFAAQCRAETHSLTLWEPSSTGLEIEPYANLTGPVTGILGELNTLEFTESRISESSIGWKEIRMVRQVREGSFQPHPELLGNVERLGQTRSHGDGSRSFQYPCASVAKSAGALGNRHESRRIVVTRRRGIRQVAIADAVGMDIHRPSAHIGVGLIEGCGQDWCLIRAGFEESNGTQLPASEGRLTHSSPPASHRASRTDWQWKQTCHQEPVMPRPAQVATVIASVEAVREWSRNHFVEERPARGSNISDVL